MCPLVRSRAKPSGRSDTGARVPWPRRCWDRGLPGVLSRGVTLPIPRGLRERTGVDLAAKQGSKSLIQVLAFWRLARPGISTG